LEEVEQLSLVILKRGTFKKLSARNISDFGGDKPVKRTWYGICKAFKATYS